MIPKGKGKSDNTAKDNKTAEEDNGKSNDTAKGKGKKSMVFIACGGQFQWAQQATRRARAFQEIKGEGKRRGYGSLADGSWVQLQ